jgi:predicted protein tyrosine phosphatase
MWKKALFLLWLTSPLLCFSSQGLCNPVLIINAPNYKGVLPKKFRTTNDPFTQEGISLKGLDTLHASGSAQFSKDGFNQILKKVPGYEMVVIDLRQESHGFLNGMAISWFCPRNWINRDKTLEQIEQEENQLLANLSEQSEVAIYRRRPNEAHMLESKQIVKKVMSECELCEKVFDVGYFRMPVADHVRPDDPVVDRFIQFVSSLPSQAWLHFHCSAGEGRTSTFMAMYDMMRNAKEVGLNDIFKRQFHLGGLSFLDEPSENFWNYSLKKERIKFLHQFYNYCKTNSDDFKQLWSDWNKIN